MARASVFLLLALTAATCGCGKPIATSALPLGSEKCSSEDAATGGEACGCNVGSRSGGSAAKGETGAASGSRSQAEVEEDMIFMEGGRFRMGTDMPILPLDGEAPDRAVNIRPYEMDRFAVTNEDFASFVAATGFVTESERYRWSFVFQHMLSQEQQDAIMQEVAGSPWWLPVENASWRHPEGGGSDSLTDGRARHPAAHISWNDAVAYCNWRGARLPTEAEWEFAAQGGVPGRLYPWGGTLLPQNKHRCNIFQGQFPSHNLNEDGFPFTAPVDAFGPQNVYGFYNLVGNVWEWVQDWFTVDRAGLPEDDPVGPPSGTEKVKKGGSFLCHKTSCYRYRVAARTKSDPESGTSNQGFRCARNAAAPDKNSQSSPAVATEEL